MPISLLLAQAAAAASAQSSARLWADTGPRAEDALPKPAVEARPLVSSGLITTDDYPLEALRLEQEGSVTVRLLVKPDGTVGDCIVTVSSGSPSLDTQTCRIYWLRARFEPARDTAGRAMASHFTQRISWRLQGRPEDLLPRQAWTTRGIASLDAKGRLVDCKLEAVGLVKPPPMCEEVAPKPVEGTAATNAPGPAVVTTILDTYFIPSDPATAKLPPDLTDATKVAQQISRIVIDPDGRVSECEGVQYSGVADPDQDACKMIQFSRFIAVDPKAAKLTGTFVATGYIRKHSVT